MGEGREGCGGRGAEGGAPNENNVLAAENLESLTNTKWYFGAA